MARMDTCCMQSADGRLPWSDHQDHVHTIDMDLYAAHLERANGHKTMSNLMYLRKAIVVTNQQRKAHIHTNSTVHHNHNCQSVQVKQKQSKNIRASWRLIGILDG